MTRYFDYPREHERDTAPLCSRCRGTGDVMGANGKRVCMRCSGTGYAGGREP
jgi:DnaJ-class molecular chaperone